MSTLLLLALATLLHPGQASLPYDIFAEPGGVFNVFIESAYVTKLEGDSIQQEFVHVKTDSKNERLSKSLDLNASSESEAPQAQSVEIPTLRYLDDDSVASLASNTSCGFCKGRLNWGETGVIQSPNFPEPYGPNMDCLWLLMAADEDARIQLVCDTIHLEPCGAHNGFAPSWRDYLIVSPLWNFKKSWVYCGHATTLNSIKHTSICDQMAVTFRSNNNNRNNIGFRCTYTVI